MNKLISQIKNLPDYDSNKIYLLEQTSENGGFFLFNDRLAFAYVSNGSRGIPLATAHLELFPNTHIKSIANCPTFAEGEFDFLLLKSESLDLLGIFTRLCRLYEKDRAIEFSDFVTKMLDLFRPKSKESKLNAIGLFGELSLIVEGSKYDKNLHLLWHRGGPRSKFDFSSEKLSIEVKSSVGENNSFLLKHSQVFGENRPYICVIKLARNEASTSLLELLNQLETRGPWSEDLRFQLALEKELSKSFDEDALNERFEVLGYYFYDCNELATINNIPGCITSISYNYEFDLDQGVSCDCFFQRISN